MSFFKKSDSVSIGIYSVYDPKIPDCKFSPPFFAFSDDLAMQAILETLRRRCTSADQLLSSDFGRMIIYFSGSFDLRSGKIKPSFKVISHVSDYLARPEVVDYLRKATYPTPQELEK